MKIQLAEYIRNCPPEKVFAAKISRKEYMSKYRGFLYCSEDDCQAKLSFVERKKNGLKYFRTWSKSHHKIGCPNEVLYDGEGEGKKYKDHGELVYLTDTHIMDKL